MCGVIALLLVNAEAPAAPEIYEALNMLQHRGQDAAGIITCRKARLFQVKGTGMVKDVFGERHMQQLHGSMGVGHVRYPTAGTSSPSEAQPFYVNSPYGIVLAHNGNLTNARDLTAYMENTVHRHINTDSDSEVLLNILADSLQRTDKVRINEEDIFKAVADLFGACRGGYACVAMLAGFGIIGFRDPHGIRPLIYGKRDNPDGTSDYIIASESACMESSGFSVIDDVQPGEAVIITKTGELHRRICVKTPQKWAPCIFEYVYFARPDSIIDGVSVYRARLAMGEELAAVVRQAINPLDVDVVIPVPDTARTAALEMASKLGLPYREGFIKNRYIGRTFIMPGQQQRGIIPGCAHNVFHGVRPVDENSKRAVRRKLHAMRLEFQNKNVLLVDDSIVRGTTSKEIIVMAREAGAAKVYFASCSPAIRFPNVYGIDMPTRAELVAYGRTDEQVAKAIGADAVVYLGLAELKRSVSQFRPDLSDFECSVFDGCYVTGDVSDAYLDALQQQRNDEAKSRLPSSGQDVSPIGLHNHLMQNSNILP